MQQKRDVLNQIAKEKRQTSVWTVVVCLFLLLGLVLTAVSIVKITTVSVRDASSLSYESMTAGDTYYFDQMVLVDAFAFNGDRVTGYAKSTHYIVRFTDKDGKLVYTSLSVDGNAELAKQCENYVNSKGLSIGDVVLSGCFHGYPNEASATAEYFEKSYQTYSKAEAGEKLDWCFYYDDAKTPEEYRSNQIVGQYVLLVLGGVIAVASLAGTLWLIRKRKKLNRKSKELV